jgi:hypothetical protein
MTEGMSMNDYLVLEKVGNRHRGVANTALGLGIAGLAVGLVGAWGLNKISESRSRAAENIAAANANRTSDLYALIAAERGSREAWQTRNQPSIGQYVDVQTNPNLNATLQDYVTAMATATATANANSPLNQAVGTDSFLKVQRYSAPQPCGCDSCNG